MKVEYGVIAPRGVHKSWEALSMTLASGGAFLRKHLVPPDWGDPVQCVAWFDTFGRCRACVGYYANGRQVLLRKDMNGGSKVTFGQVPASVDTHPKDGDALAAPLVSGAVGSEADETPTPDRHSAHKGE